MRRVAAKKKKRYKNVLPVVDLAIENDERPILLLTIRNCRFTRED